MDKRYRRRRAVSVSLAMLLLAAGLLLSACAVPVQVDLNATAQAMAHTWATQTAEAGSGSTAVSPTRVEAPSATPIVETALPAPTETTMPTKAPSPTSTMTSPPPGPATATSTVTPKPTGTNTQTPSPTPPCSVAVDPALASGWDYAKDACPTAPAAIVWSAWQPFEHGYMLWTEDNDSIYVLNYGGGTDSKQGGWATGGESWRWDGISFPDGHGLTPPEGQVEPIRGFGHVWFEKLGGPSGQLGWGTAEEKGFCALVQRFGKGLLVQSSATSGCGQFNWAAQSDFSPVFVALHSDSGWKRF